MSRQLCSQSSDMPKSPQLNVDIRWVSQIAPWNTNRNLGNILDISPALHVYLLGMVWRDSQIQDRSLCVYNHWSAGQFVLDIITYPAHQCAWWRHQMEIFSASLALCAGNSPVSHDFPEQRPVTRSFDVFLYLRLNKRLSKQLWGGWAETPSCWLWRHCNGNHFLGSPSVVKHSQALMFWKWFKDLTYLPQFSLSCL